jgi:hypothetical protein
MECDADPQAKGQRRLWNGVLLQAIDDATHWVNPDAINYLRLSLDVERAREWLTIPNRDFDQVCALAGIEPCRVRAHAAQEIAKAIARPPRPRRPTANRGAGQNLPSSGDRSSKAARGGAEIDFSQNRETAPCL